jgi:hypothetical protein
MSKRKSPTTSTITRTTTSAPKRVKSETRVIDTNAIASVAYEKFVARGGEHGHDVEDWLAAEAELRTR